MKGMVYVIDQQIEYGNQLYANRAEAIVDLVGRYLPDISTVLGLGTDKGRLVTAFSKAGIQAYGIDLRAAFKGDRSQFAIADARSLPFRDACFDLVCERYLFRDMTNSQHLHPSELERVLQEVRRVLKPEGHFLSIPRFHPPTMKKMRFVRITSHDTHFPLYRKVD